MAEYIMSSSKAELSGIFYRRKKSDPGATKTDGISHAKLLVLDCWLVNSVFQKYDFGLLLSSHFRSGRFGILS